MSQEYGIKILNYSAGSIAEVSQGVRDMYDTTPAMLTNSLFLDFLKDNGLKISKNDFTRDVICIDFNYGSSSAEKELAKIRKHASQNRINRKIAKASGLPGVIKKAENTNQWLQRRYKRLQENKDNFVEISQDVLREEFYVNGVNIRYPMFNRNKEIVDYKNIHYKMLYRTPGKAKVGKCMFICDRLYKKAHKYLWMGIRIPKRNAPIVEIGAYSSLVTSTIQARVKIEPENILVLKDVDAFFKTNVLSVEIDNEKHCYLEEKKDYEIKNTIFDGQALIDDSIFPPWGSGYVLLRQHFFKAAAFRSCIQDYYKDYFGDEYDTAIVTDMWGNKHLAKDIKLITTDNALKFLKFNVSYEYWSDRVWDNGALFGIVKTDHPSKYSDKQRMSYQMVNALDLETIDEVIAPTKEYIYQLKTNDEVYFDFLRRTANFCSDNEVLLALVEQNPEFVRSRYFVDRRSKKISNYVLDVKQGHIIQNGDNLVIVGNPYGMLMYSVGLNPLDDPTFHVEDDCIQCYTKQFAAGEFLAEFRSPFNSCHNLGYLHNIQSCLLDKYFKFSKQIIAVNMVGTDFQDLNNGSDMDSDMILCTNQKNIVDRARYCYNNYYTVVNNIPKEKNIYNNVLKDYALVDNKLSASQLDIGESSNIAQVGLSYTYNEFGKQYDHYVAILAILAQVSVDSSKRAFDVDVHSEIQRIKLEMDVENNGIPAFFAGINPGKRKKVNPNIVCPMNSVFTMKNASKKPEAIIPTEDFFVPHQNVIHKKTSHKVEQFIQNYAKELMLFNINQDDMNYNDYLLLRSDYDDLIKNLRSLNLSDKYLGLMSWLINRAFKMTAGVKRNSKTLETTLNKNRSVLLKVLYDLNPKMLKKCFKTSTVKSDDL